MSEEKLPMDAMEDNGGAAPPAAAPAPAVDRARDESGRFAPKEPANDGQQPTPQPRREPIGKPDPDQAYKRTVAERDQYKTQFETLQKRLEDMSAVARGEDPNAPKEPEDKLKPLAEKIESIDKRLQTNDEARQAEAIHAQVLQYADQDEQRFRQQAPDFQDAVGHYITSRLREMAALGLNQAQAEQELKVEANALLYQCAEAGRSPAEAIYNLAQARGYAPQTGGQAPTTGGRAPGTVVPFQQFAPQPQPQPTYTRRSMGTGAGPAGGGVTAQQITQMSEEDYNAFRETPEGKAAIRRALMGG